MYTQIVLPESPCGCGGGKPFGECHLGENGIVFSAHSITPPLPKTGLTHPKCYLRGTNDCCEDISGDHIVSKAALKIISPKAIKVTSPKREFIASINGDSITTKCLCRRHNSALSALDIEAKRLAETILQVDASLRNVSDIPVQKFFLFNGLDIERWLLKTLYAVYNAKLTDISPDTHTIKAEAANLFLDERWPARYGLYIRSAASVDTPIPSTLSAEYTVQLVPRGEEVVGLILTILGLEFVLSISKRRPVALAEAEGVFNYRPQNLCFFQGDEVRTIHLTWPISGGGTLWISRSSASATRPTGIGQ